MIIYKKKKLSENLRLNFGIGPSIKEITKDKIKKTANNVNEFLEIIKSTDLKKEYIEIQNKVIPKKYQNVESFRKHGPELKLSSNPTKKQALSEKHTLENRFLKKIKLLHLPHRALQVNSIYPPGTKNMYQLLSFINGCELKLIFPKKIEIKKHNGDFTAMVPSTSRIKKYELELNSLPYDHASWYNFGTDTYCKCEDSRFSKINSKYKGEKRICKHFVAANLAVHEFLEKNKLEPLKVNITPIPFEPMMKIKDILRYNTIININGRRRPINKTEIEVVLQYGIKKFDINNCFTFKNPIDNLKFAEQYLLKQM